ncbi:N(G),N(G)-dimethylarginine dimethylaminohydrolase 1-like [Paramacrobiotus metropolitanus]|uniref:N(G),N(G)-dimethylarginine dimethylaminohydrolase 1-like n=1 Tax=Paramacrobiotus metropolitanus TaxID=2943436 RepID=UPI002445E6C5|nr:N(G),N(G)-dimethylarginine dimethylaminohydrolase 1-like [Paramacrobiotus metropolitanus]
MSGSISEETYARGLGGQGRSGSLSQAGGRMFHYTDAIVCGVPDSFIRGQTSLSLATPVDVRKARDQHRVYVDVLRKLGMDVWELDPDEALPDSPFVEDTAVIIGPTALVCRPGVASRESEVKVVKSILMKEFPDIELVEMKNERARLDGGDVLFTGREIFVGISKRTNELGAQEVARAFPDYPCLGVRVENALHLKTLVTLAGPRTLVAGDSPSARKMVQKIESDAIYRYDIIHVTDDLANTVYANGTLVHKAGYPNAAKILTEKLRCPKVSVDLSEFAKLEGHLTCCSLLLSRTASLGGKARTFQR